MNTSAYVTLIYLLMITALPAQEWYESNIDLFDISRISTSEIENYKMVLKLTRTERRELRELYQDGHIIRSNIRIYSVDQWLLSDETFNAEGILLERRIYFYEPDGIPRSVFREIPSDPTMVDQLTFYRLEEDGLSIFEIPFTTAFSYTLYDAKGRIISREEQEQDQPPRKEASTYFEDGRSQKSIESDGIKREIQYQGGLKRTERVYQEDILVAFIVYTYDDQDRLSSVLEQLPEHTLETRFLYDEEGTILQETLIKDGVLFRNIEYHDDTQKTELLYREGTLFLRVVFRDEIMVERVFFDESGRPVDVLGE